MKKKIIKLQSRELNPGRLGKRFLGISLYNMHYAICLDSLMCKMGVKPVAANSNLLLLVANISVHLLRNN